MPLLVLLQTRFIYFYLFKFYLLKNFQLFVLHVISEIFMKQETFKIKISKKLINFDYYDASLFPTCIRIYLHLIFHLPVSPANCRKLSRRNSSVEESGL